MEEEPLAKKAKVALKKEPEVIVKKEDSDQGGAAAVVKNGAVAAKTAASAETAVKSESFSDDEDTPLKPHKPRKDRDTSDLSTQCPYLDTIDRHLLDFDFEKLCSVSLSRINVYACLVCGKYFQGRGPNTHAYTHSVSEGHRVFLNLETKRFYCLPDNYEIIDPSLDDIIYVLNPTFTPQLIKKLETSTKEVGN